MDNFAEREKDGFMGNIQYIAESPSDSSVLTSRSSSLWVLPGPQA